MSGVEPAGVFIAQMLAVKRSHIVSTAIRWWCAIFLRPRGRLEIEHLPVGEFEVYVVAPFCVEETLAVALGVGEHHIQRVSLRAASRLRARSRADGATSRWPRVSGRRRSAPPRRGG